MYKYALDIWIFFFLCETVANEVPFNHKSNLLSTLPSVHMNTSLFGKSKT